jgi:hypothetical protein
MQIPGQHFKGTNTRSLCTCSSIALPLLAGMTCILAGCAGISVTQLDPATDKPKHGAAEGVRYYLPAPYLLVAELPPTPMADSNTNDDGGGVRKPAPGSPPPDMSGDHNAPDTSGTNSTPQPGGGANTNQTGNPTSPKGSDPTQGTASPAPVTDTSFGGTTPQYVIKLVYLPDMSKPMAMSEHAGFGTAEMKPSLQDGWMLTSLDASADSKTAETLTALASLVSSSVSPLAAGAKAATSTGTPKPGGGPSTKNKQPQGLSNLFTRQGTILRPGLYRFVYDETTGELTDLKAVVYFSGYGTTHTIPASQ